VKCCAALYWCTELRRTSRSCTAYYITRHYTLLCCTELYYSGLYSSAALHYTHAQCTLPYCSAQSSVTLPTLLRNPREGSPGWDNIIFWTERPSCAGWEEGAVTYAAQLRPSEKRKDEINEEVAVVRMGGGYHSTTEGCIRAALQAVLGETGGAGHVRTALPHLR
jgi:hypothetical protein